MDGDATEEDEEHEEPFEVFAEGGQEGALAGAVAESCEGGVAKAVKNDDKRNINVPAVDVVLIDV
jgi:hypothetical protein